MAPSDNYDGTGIQYFEIPNFQFVKGGTGWYTIKVAYRVFNEGKEKTVLVIDYFFATRGVTRRGNLFIFIFNAIANNICITILTWNFNQIPTCYGGKINTTLNFSTSALKYYQVIVVAMLGNGESSSPSNDPSWPASVGTTCLRYADCINAQYALLKYLGVRQLESVIGFSMGGQQ